MPLNIVRYEDHTAWREPGVPEPEDLRRLLDQGFHPPAGCLLLAYDPETPEKIIGMAGFIRVTEDVCEARRAVVGWNHQKRGVGRALLQRLIHEARLTGYAGMRVQVSAGVPALVAFYQRMGFVPAPAEYQVPGWLRMELALRGTAA